MAKVAFSKLKCKVNDSVTELKLNDEITIEVKQYLPIQEKLKLIGKVLEWAHEPDFNYSNPVKMDVYYFIEMVLAYTNITLTEKQYMETPKIYDLLSSSGILNMIFEAIPQSEKDMIYQGIERTVKSVYAYETSILGILDAIKQNYNAMELDVEELKNNLASEENFELVKGLLTNLN